MFKWIFISVLAFGSWSIGTAAHATLVSLGSCTGGVACTITDSPPNPILPNPNDGVLLAWNEVQNHVLIDDLVVDRVFDETATFIEKLDNGKFLIKAGTMVSSHYLQWDPLPRGSSTIQTTITLDSTIFAFITSDQTLFDSDPLLGLPNFDYSDFTLRGLEGQDSTVYNGSSVTIDWRASSPGDWARLVTAYSPAAPVPVPGAAPLFLVGLAAVARSVSNRRKPLH